MICGSNSCPPSAAIARGLYSVLKTDSLVDLYAQEQRHLEQHALQLPNGDVIDGAGAKLAVELLCAQVAQIRDDEWPQMEHIVPGDAIAFLQHHHLGAQQLGLDGGAQSTGPCSDDQDACASTGSSLAVDSMGSSGVELLP